MSTVRVVISLVSLIIVLVVVQSVALRITQNQSGTINIDKKPAARQEVQSLRITPSPMTSRSTPTTSVPTVTPSVRIKSGISPTLFPSQAMKPATVILNNFIYANSTIIEQDDTHATLQTFDAAQTVFQWYEKKIEELNGRAKAIVKTEVNDEFLAKLRATVKNDIINIEIRKKAEEKSVFIVITISPS